MPVETHLPSALVTVIDALRGGIDEAQRQLERAQHVEWAVIGMAALTLRSRGLQQQGMTDAHIAHLLGIDEDRLTAAMQDVQLEVDGTPDWHLRVEIEQLWMSLRRRASVWFQTDEVDKSHQVVARNNVDISSWPLALEALDTPAAEFVHQTSGQKIIVYSLQGRLGTPTVVDGKLRSWDGRGHYRVEFVSGPALRSPMDLMAFGLGPGANSFRGQPDDDSVSETFGLIVGAIRRMCGPLAPYAEAASFDPADPAPE